MTRLSILTAFGILLAATAWGETASKGPHIGFLYPAGGQQGTVIHIAAGGQFLRGAAGVHITEIGRAHV